MNDEAAPLEPRPAFLQVTAGATSGAAATVSAPALLEVAAQVTSGAAATVSAPLVQVGGIAVYPTTGASQVIIRREGSRFPRIEAHLREKIWDMNTIGVGVAVGAPFGGRVGAGIGGIVMYAWGRWCWAKSDDS